MDIKSLKNKSLTKPEKFGDSILYGMGEIALSKIGSRCSIGEFSRVRHSNIGNYVKIDRNNFLVSTDMGDRSYTGPFDMIFNCKIGRYTSISYGVTIGPPEHDYSLLSTHPFIYDSYYEIFEKEDLKYNNKLDRPLQIGNDVWIGCNSTILRGLEIGDGAVVGANSIVNKDVPPYAIVAGCPAKLIKYRFPQDIIKRLLEIKWWNWEILKIKQNAHLFKHDITLEKLNQII